MKNKKEEQESYAEKFKKFKQGKLLAEKFKEYEKKKKHDSSEWHHIKSEKTKDQIIEQNQKSKFGLKSFFSHFSKSHENKKSLKNFVIQIPKPEKKVVDKKENRLNTESKIKERSDDKENKEEHVQEKKIKESFSLKKLFSFIHLKKKEVSNPVIEAEAKASKHAEIKEEADKGSKDKEESSKSSKKEEIEKQDKKTPKIFDNLKKFEFKLLKIKKFFLKLFSKNDALDKIDSQLKKFGELEDKKKENEKKQAAKEFQTNLSLLRKIRKKKKIKISRYDRIRKLKSYLEKAGYSLSDETSISKMINIFSAIVVGILSLYLIYAGVLREDMIVFILTQFITIWLIIFPAFIVASWVTFYFIIDFKIYNRKKQVEEVLPDFLQLTSANINAGMTIDRALWFAVRPRFGILAKEIEEVAKSTFVGEDLKDALTNFSKKYDSKILKRTINLLIEGLDAGGELGGLLNKISVDIQETRIIKKDMAANVTTYVIFISFATVAAAPFLFALSNQMLSIITSLVSNINIPPDVSASSMISLNSSEPSISARDFKIFAISTLAMTSFFSAIIVSIIQKGNVKDGIKYIPTFIAISVSLFIIASKILGYFLGGII